MVQITCMHQILGTNLTLVSSVDGNVSKGGQLLRGAWHTRSLCTVWRVSQTGGKPQPRQTYETGQNNSTTAKDNPTPLEQRLTSINVEGYSRVT